MKNSKNGESYTGMWMRTKSHVTRQKQHSNKSPLKPQTSSWCINLMQIESQTQNQVQCLFLQGLPLHFLPQPWHPPKGRKRPNAQDRRLWAASCTDSAPQLPSRASTTVGTNTGWMVGKGYTQKGIVIQRQNASTNMGKRLIEWILVNKTRFKMSYWKN